MTNDLKERLGAYGQPGKRGSDHPQSVVCRDALARIIDLEARLAAAEGKLTEWQSSQSYRYIGRDGKPVLARDLEARAEAAEAGEDALAEAARKVLNSGDHTSNMLIPAWVKRVLSAALAGHEARRKG